jgi:hypothetical protein
MAESSYTVKGMTCEHCVPSVTEAGYDWPAEITRAGAVRSR